MSDTAVGTAPLTARVGGSDGAGAARNLALATLAFGLCFCTFGLIAPLATKFEDDLGLSSTAALLLTAVPVILGSLLRLPVGALTDRYGGRRVFTVLLALSALPAVLFGYAESYAALLGVGFLLGIAGSSFAVGVPFVAGWYKKERQGFALGVYGVGNIGSAVAAFSVPGVVNSFGRPALGWTVGAILLAAAAGFALLARDAPRRAQSGRYRDVLRSGMRLWRLAYFYFVAFGGFVAMSLILPKLLGDWFGYSLVDAGLRAAGFTIAATIARPVGGALADRFGAYPVLVLSFAGIAVDSAMLAALAPNPRIIPITVACLSLACFFGACNGAVFKLVATEFPQNAGAAGGIVGAAGGLGGFFPPIFVGIVKDASGHYTLGFVGLLIATVVCLLAGVWLLRAATTPTVPPGFAVAGSDRGLLLASSDPLFAVDHELRVITWNSPLEQLTGITAQDAIGRHCSEILPHSHADGCSLCELLCSSAELHEEGYERETGAELVLPTAQGRRRVSLSTVQIRHAGQLMIIHTLLGLGTPRADDEQLATDPADA